MVTRHEIIGRSSSSSHLFASTVISKLLKVAALCIGLATIHVCRGDWIRFFAAPSAKSSEISFGIASVEEKDKGLLASAWYRHAAGRTAVTLHGKKATDKTFQPRVTYEVATVDKATWLPVPLPTTDAVSDDFVVVDERHRFVELGFSMEPFRKLVGFAKFGRVVLENGDAATFELDELLPTHPSADCGGGDFKISITMSADEKRRAGFKNAWIVEPVILVAVRSQGGQLVGLFDYWNHGSDPVSLEGGRTLDGEFWPGATSQVSETGDTWETLPKTETNGAPDTVKIVPGSAQQLRVNLNAYQRFCTGYKYGKIIFSDGHFVVFSIPRLWTAEHS